MNSHNQYWYMLVAIKYKHVYYQLYKEFNKRIDTLITFILSILTFVGISAWIFSQEITYVWAAFLFLVQILQIYKSMLPFAKRIQPLQFLVDDMHRLILDIQSDLGRLSVKEPAEIDELTNKYLSKFNTMEYNYLRDMDLPRKDFFRYKINLEVNDYFYSRYGIKPIKGDYQDNI